MKKIDVRTIYAIAALLVNLVPPGVRAENSTDISCLKPEQVQRLSATYAKIRDMFDLEASMNKLLDAKRKKAAIADEAAECNRRQNDPLAALGAMLDDCRSTLIRYNTLHRDERMYAEDLKTSQNLVLRQMELERAQYPVCR